jgi:hypothetical protein
MGEREKSPGVAGTDKSAVGSAGSAAESTLGREPLSVPSWERTALGWVGAWPVVAYIRGVATGQYMAALRQTGPHSRRARHAQHAIGPSFECCTWRQAGSVVHLPGWGEGCGSRRCWRVSLTPYGSVDAYEVVILAGADVGVLV